ncbi:FMN-dependent NADH-azoreductase [Actinocatenispora thailandica]|uniref:FMN dependent NADH:quinone oxidoreductase n=1 Tax=Actinocatenispora thailandica TaxID=227318 RepID=A0A7R7DM49_9ACTN|nr:NAD(P)H-dependent oxidoreductase [Actinocatenispora thailandica]BCJ34244.1 FMN-dependent NADH-azoreductase [Actinocatenispora thailandica]
MTLLRIDSSIQGDGSSSSALADQVVSAFRAARPADPIVTRHLGEQPLPADAWRAALGAKAVPDEQRTPAARAALALAGEVADELRAADAAVLALPLYNYGVSQHVKTWIDLAIAGADQGAALLAGTPVVLVTTRGGAYGPGTPREGWDHNTGYLRRILADVWGAQLTVVEREFTLVGVNPALDEFREHAAMLRKSAEEAAAEAGRALAA